MLLSTYKVYLTRKCFPNLLIVIFFGVYSKIGIDVYLAQSTECVRCRCLAICSNQQV